jgi:tetrahydromethanopterin S-methyltransferase subunit B
VDYQTAENQALQLQQQADQVGQGIKTLAEKLQAKIGDPNLSRELILDLKEAALAIQRQNQSALMLIQQMAEYIHSLETHVNSLPQQPAYPAYQTRGWAAQPYAGTGGGFMGNVVSGLGLGAGFGLASDLVSSIFNAW